jgi:hypothetical protein
MIFREFPSVAGVIVAKEKPAISSRGLVADQRGETGPGIGLGRSAVTASATSYLNRFMRLLKKRRLRPHMLTAGHFILPLNLIFSFVFVVLYFVGKKEEDQDVVRVFFSSHSFKCCRKNKIFNKSLKLSYFYFACFVLFISQLFVAFNDK